MQMRTVKQWNRLSQEVFQSPTLEVFKTKLGKALSNLISYLIFLGTGDQIRDLLRSFPP